MANSKLARAKEVAELLEQYCMARDSCEYWITEFFKLEKQSDKLETQRWRPDYEKRMSEIEARLTVIARKMRNDAKNLDKWYEKYKTFKAGKK